MGQIILIDGPEKTGKSTLIKELNRQLEGTGIPVHNRRWGAVKPDDRVYSAPLQQDLNALTKGITIWDRGWPSEHVYGSLLNRPRRGSTNPWILEWLHGRALHGRGAKVILLPHDVTEPTKYRDDTDLPVNVLIECATYQQYAKEFSYDVYVNDYTEDTAERNASRIIESLPEELPISGKYLSLDASHRFHDYRLIVGEARNPKDFQTMAGAWMPFSSAKMCSFVQKYFSNSAFQFAWCNTEDFQKGVLPLTALNTAAEVFTFGKSADMFVARHNITPKASFMHPAFFARWNTDRGRAALQEFEQQYKQAFGI